MEAHLDRRRLLLGGLTALGTSALLARSARAGVRLAVGPALLGAEGAGAPPLNLVLIQLAGGNDGLNTLVPLGDEAYHRARPTSAAGCTRSCAA